MGASVWRLRVALVTVASAGRPASGNSKAKLKSKLKFSSADWPVEQMPARGPLHTPEPVIAKNPPPISPSGVPTTTLPPPAATGAAVMANARPRTIRIRTTFARMTLARMTLLPDLISVWAKTFWSRESIYAECNWGDPQRFDGPGTFVEP